MSTTQAQTGTLYKEINYIVSKKNTKDLIEFFNSNPLAYHINYIIENELISLTYNNKGIDIEVAIVGKEVYFIK